MSHKQICAVCNSIESKYKCPKCFIRYCGLVCFKNHKEGDSCIDQIQKTSEQTEIKTSDAVNKYLNRLDEDDILDEEVLSKLWESPLIKSAIKNKDLVEIMKALNSSAMPDSDFLKFTNVPIFSDFIDECLKQIKSDVE